jgi:hypothetical protein
MRWPAGHGSHLTRLRAARPSAGTCTARVTSSEPAECPPGLRASSQASSLHVLQARHRQAREVFLRLRWKLACLRVP